MAEIEQARLLRPEQAEWRADLAELQLARGWNEEALAEINQAIAIAPTIGRLWRIRAELQLRLEQPNAARADLIESYDGAIRMTHEASHCWRDC